ncbi:MAG: glycosyltransferase [SAR324 cluster bacterium]|uniref:Glycosyltransferase n=1 Tax=SAR324 cluster bacterium TaxID=2024889 RepID=A0A7X9FRA4_9DELT|nr:glycosyltransferase [SAR324 cluster bacterium]
MKEPIRIAWFSDLSREGKHSRSLSSYVSKQLLPILSKTFDIEVFSTFMGSFDAKEVRHFLTAFKRNKEKPFDIFFYQFEDSPKSFFSRAHLALLPGVVWFHDFFLTNDGPEPLLNSSWEDTVIKFNNASTEWAPMDKEYTRPKPQAYRESGMTFLPIFSSERDHNEYKRVIEKKIEHANLRSFYLPIPCELVKFQNIGTLDLKLLFCGSPKIEHRVHKLLQGLREARSEWSLIWLLEDEELEKANELLREFEISKVELRTPRSPELFAELLKEARISIHMLFSVYGHLSPYLPLSLSSGLPCIVSDFASSSLLADNLVFKVQPGDNEASQVSMLLDKLEALGGPGSIDVASKFANENHNPEVVAGELSAILSNYAPKLADAMKRWVALEQDARRALSSWLLRNEERVCFKEAFEELGWISQGETR